MVLAYLAEAAPRVVPPQELVREAQGYASTSLDEANETLRYHVHRLRQKIKKLTGRAEYIQTVHGVGYQLNDPLLASRHPTGTVTFLFSDIVGSTQLWEISPTKMKAALTRHDALLRQVFEAQSGYIFKTIGDELCVAFASAAAALQAALEAQRALRAELWPTALPLRVRMVLQTGQAEEYEGDYFGPTVNRTARLLAAGHGEQILLSDSTRAALAEQLPAEVNLRDLGMRRFKGLREPERVFQVLAPDLPENFPPLTTLDLRPSNLPSELTSFIGREAELKLIGDLLRDASTHLLTLVGTGGTGKTRLSLQAATRVLDEYEDGVWFVSLAVVRSPDLVASVIAQALHAPETDHPLETLVNHLRQRQLLLVLDNFEHLLEGAALVNELLQQAPRLKILVTSREALHLYGERLFPVLPLAVPEPTAKLTLALLEKFAAPQLFIRRAQAGGRPLEWTDADAPAIIEICAWLDGLPLALELAAAYTTQFRPMELLAQLTNRLHLLNAGPRDLPTRQRTLRGLLDWSYDLLTPAGQSLFRHMAVFVGGWSLPAAQAMLAEPIPAAQLMSELQELQAKSLIYMLPASEAGLMARYTMLETLREYAEEQLNLKGELTNARQRHAEHFCQVGEAAEDGLRDARQKETLALIEADHNNFRAALIFVGGADPLLALRLSAVLWRFWAMRSHLREGRQWLEQALRRTSNAPFNLRAKALFGAGRLALFQKDYATASGHLQKSLDLYRKVEDPDGVAWALNSLGEVAFIQGDLAQARPYLEESLQLHRALGHKLGTAKALDDLGRIALEGRQADQAVTLFEESLVLRREFGSVEGTAIALISLGEAFFAQGNYQRAEELTRESLALYQDLNHVAGAASCWHTLARLYRLRESFKEEALCYAASLGLLHPLEHEEKQLIAECLVGLGRALYAAGQAAQAAQVLGMAEKWLAIPDVQLASAEQEAFENAYDAVRVQLGRAAWTRLWSLGQAMALEDVLVLLNEKASQ